LRLRLGELSRFGHEQPNFLKNHTRFFKRSQIWGIEKFVIIGLPPPTAREFGAGWDEVIADLYSGFIEGVLNGRNFNKPDVIGEFRRVHFSLIQKY